MGDFPGKVITTTTYAIKVNIGILNPLKTRKQTRAQNISVNRALRAGDIAPLVSSRVATIFCPDVASPKVPVVSALYSEDGHDSDHPGPAVFVSYSEDGRDSGYPVPAVSALPSEAGRIPGHPAPAISAGSPDGGSIPGHLSPPV